MAIAAPRRRRVARVQRRARAHAERSSASHGPLSFVFQTPLLGASSLTLAARVEDTELTVAILDLTYEYEPPEGDDAYELDIADAEDDGADVEDMEDEDPDARSQDHGDDFDGSSRTFRTSRRRKGSRQQSKAQREPAARQSCSSAARAQEERPPKLSAQPKSKGVQTKHQVTGWLEKQKKKGLFGRKWQKRWFELEAHYLVYKTKETGEILAAIDMRGVDSVVIEPLKDKRKDKDSGTDANQVAASTTFCLNLGGTCASTFFADGVDTMREWVDAINERLSTYNRLFGKQGDRRHRRTGCDRQGVEI